MAVERNLALHAELIAQAAGASCDLIVFPELSVTGHNGTAEVTRAAQPLDGPFLNRTKEFRLKIRGQLGNLVQKKRTSVCLLEPTDPPRCSIRKRALFISKEFRL